MATNSSKEIWQPLPHVAPAGFKNSILFYLRLFFDISVFTTYQERPEPSTKNGATSQ
jgi:hypothetical protein